MSDAFTKQNHDIEWQIRERTERYRQLMKNRADLDVVRWHHDFGYSQRCLCGLSIRDYKMNQRTYKIPDDICQKSPNGKQKMNTVPWAERAAELGRVESPYADYEAWLEWMDVNAIGLVDKMEIDYRVELYCLMTGIVTGDYAPTNKECIKTIELAEKITDSILTRPQYLTLKMANGRAGRDLSWKDIFRRIMNVLDGEK